MEEEIREPGAVRTNDQLRSDIDKGMSEVQSTKDPWGDALQRQQRERNSQNGVSTYGQMKELVGRQELAELQNGQRAQDAIASALAIAEQNGGKLPSVVTDYLNRQFGFDGQTSGIIDGGIDPKTGDFGFVFGERDEAGNTTYRKQMIPLSVQLGLKEGYPSLFNEDAVKAHRQKMLDSGLASGEVEAYSNVARLARERLSKRMEELTPRDTKMEIEQLKEEGRNRRAEASNQTRLDIANASNLLKQYGIDVSAQLKERGLDIRQQNADERSAHNLATEAQAKENEEGRNRRAEGKTAGGKSVDPQKSVAAMKGMLELARSSGMSSEDLAQLEAWTQERIKGMAAGGETSGDGQTGKKVSYNGLKPGQTFTATGKDGKRHRYRKTENGYERIN